MSVELLPIQSYLTELFELLSVGLFLVEEHII